MKFSGVVPLRELNVLENQQLVSLTYQKDLKQGKRPARLSVKIKYPPTGTSQINILFLFCIKTEVLEGDYPKLITCWV